MTIWRKVGTLFRASAYEPAERLVDANALRIMAQELRETEQAMIRAKRELANLMAESKQLERSNQHLEKTIALRESQAQQALARAQESLALELAERIAEDENLLQEQREHLQRLTGQEKALRQNLQAAARTLQHYKREMSLARANENAEQVLQQLGSHTVGLRAHMGDLESSLTRIRDRQSRASDVSDALQELDEEAKGGGLDQKLQQAGIPTGKQDANSVLERIRGAGNVAG